MAETVQVRILKKTHKKLMELRKTDLGTVRLYEIIDKLVEDYEKRKAVRQ